MPKTGLQHRVVDNDQLNSEKQEVLENISGVFLNLDANIEHVFLRYYIGDRNVNVGNAKKIGLHLLLPDEDLYNHKWLFDGDNKIDLENYEIDMNMVFASSSINS
jgi:hypothetical protein